MLAQAGEMYQEPRASRGKDDAGNAHFEEEEACGLTPFRYPGAKRKLAPVILQQLDKYLSSADRFCDVFVGGGSLLCAVAKEYPNLELHANDKDYLVYCFWHLIETGSIESLIDLLYEPVTLEMRTALKNETTTDPLRCAYKALVLNRTSFSGILHAGPIGGKNQ